MPKPKRGTDIFLLNHNACLILGTLCIHVINSWVLQLVWQLLESLLYCHERVQSDRPLAQPYDLSSGQLLSHIWVCPASEPVVSTAEMLSEEANGASLPWHSTAIFCPRLYTHKYLDSVILKINICSSSGLLLLRHWKPSLLEKMCYDVASEVDGDSL